MEITLGYEHNGDNHDVQHRHTDDNRASKWQCLSCDQSFNEGGYAIECITNERMNYWNEHEEEIEQSLESFDAYHATLKFAYVHSTCKIPDGWELYDEMKVIHDYFHGA